MPIVTKRQSAKFDRFRLLAAISHDPWHKSVPLPPRTAHRTEAVKQGLPGAVVL